MKKIENYKSQKILKMRIKKNILLTNRYSLIKTFEKLKNSEIYCFKDSYAEIFCKRNKIKFKSFKSRQDFKIILKKNLNSQIYLNGCKYLLDSKQLKDLKFIPINIHPSLLPNYKGQFIVDKIFYNNEKYIGATIHHVNDQIDSGKILHQEKVKNDFKYSIILMYHKLFELEKYAFEQYLIHGKREKLNIKKKRTIHYKNKKFYTINEIFKLDANFILSKCVPGKYLTIKYNLKFKKILFCYMVKKSHSKNNFEILSNDHLLVRLKDKNRYILIIK